MNQPPQPGQPAEPPAGDWGLDTPVQPAADFDAAGATEVVSPPAAPPSYPAAPPSSPGTPPSYPSPSPVEPPVLDYPDSGYAPPGYPPSGYNYPANYPGPTAYAPEEPPISYGAVGLPGTQTAGAAAWIYPGAPEGQPVPKKSRKKWVIVAATVLVVALAGGGIAIYQVFFSGKADREAVGTAATEFTRAAAGGDLAGVKGLLCDSEAAGVPDVIAASGASGVPDKDVQVNLGAVDVRKDLASAVVTKGSNPDVTLYLRKQGGGWKVCASAESDFDSAAK